MKLADRLRLAKNNSEPIQENWIEQADVLESAYRDDHDALTKANTPVADPVCSITLTDAGWYEWVIKGRKCEFGYHTWREAHQAARAVLAEDKKNFYLGKIRGVLQHLKAMKMACSGVAGLCETLGRLIRYLEEIPQE